MIGLVDWASARARMVFTLVLMSLVAGAMAYFGLPKEGEPDIDVPFLYVSVPFPGISASDSEKLLIRPLENELKGIDGLKTMTANAAENYGGVGLEFNFGWDKQATIADVRDKVSRAEAKFPAGAEQYTITEVNFSQFPIIVISLSGAVPERTLLRVAKDLQTKLEGLPQVLEAGLAGHRNEMLEVLIDPLKLEAYNVTAGELLAAVRNNNQLIAAGEVETRNGAFAVKIPSSFDSASDVYGLPVKVNGDSIITLGDLADIRLTFEDRLGTARYNGNATVALQIVKRKGANQIKTVKLVRDTVNNAMKLWPNELKQAIHVDFALDQSKKVASMVSQLESSVLTAILLVMVVILGTLGVRSALLVGFAIPTSFLLSFAFMALAGIAISNMVMFGLILAVGMLVDGAIVVVEYADKRISEGTGPMHSYVMAAKRMFWPIISSTATTLCAFLPMLFWPGVPGEFMRNLPITLIYVLSSSLLVALIYLPVVGGVAGRLTQVLEHLSGYLNTNKHILIRLTLLALTAASVIGSAILAMKGMETHATGLMLLGAGGFIPASFALSVAGGSIFTKPETALRDRSKRTLFGHVIHYIVDTPFMSFLAIFATLAFVVMTFITYMGNNYGTEFFVKTEPENGIVYVRARGNLSLQQKDALVRSVEQKIIPVKGIASVFSFAGAGGLNQNKGGATAPLDTIGQILFELDDWKIRGTGTGDAIIANVKKAIGATPGYQTEIFIGKTGPAAGKPLNLRIKGDNWGNLMKTTAMIRTKLDEWNGLKDIEDTRPLPGIDWQIKVDVKEAGRYGANVASVGAMVQLVTRGLLLDTMRVDSSADEIDIRVRVPQKDRLLSTLDTLRVRTATGLIPLSNFITRTPVKKLGQINRVDSTRYFDVKADVKDGVNSNDMIAKVTKWLKNDVQLPPGISWEWSGSQEDQQKSIAFLKSAFAGALGLMFIILLTQFNSFYNSFLVLLAVVLSTAGVLIGMMVMHQPFSTIMTGTGIVALAGIVVNNNIVLIDTYQEYARRMPKLQAIVATAEARIRPVMLTTITTMAGLFPMMMGLSIDFHTGGYSLNAPTSLWWKQLATAVVFGLGIATVLTLILTPALLAMRVWIVAMAKYPFARARAHKTGKKQQSLHDIAYADIAE